MADLSIPTPTFVAGNTIVASETNANNAAIVTYINNKQNGTTAFDQVKSAAQIQAQPTTNQLRLGNPSAFNTLITAPAPTATRTITIPDGGADSSFVLTQGTQTISGTKTFDGQLIGKGTTAVGNAASGYIGEIVSSSTSAVNVPTSGQWGNNTSVSLTAGDWLVSYFLDFIPNGATVTAGNTGIGTVTGNDSTNIANGDTAANLNTPTGSLAAASTSLPFWRTNVSSTTVYYLKISVTYTVATPQYRGRITALRIR
jgi:hypothetical protein